MTLAAMFKFVAAMVATKGVVMAVVVIAVLHSSLNDFEKAVIIAAVSATVTGLFTFGGMVMAARISTHAQQEVREDVRVIKEQVTPRNETTK